MPNPSNLCTRTWAWVFCIPVAMILLGMVGEFADLSMIKNTHHLSPVSYLSKLDIGSQAPDFILLDANGASHALGDYDGMVVLLNFWATWCRPCLEEMPSMERAYEAFHGDGLVVIGISSDPHGREVTQPFAKSTGITFPILHDTDYLVSGYYGVRALPMSFVIDRDGLLTHRIFGARDWSSSSAYTFLRNIIHSS